MRIPSLIATIAYSSMASFLACFLVSFLALNMPFTFGPSQAFGAIPPNTNGPFGAASVLLNPPTAADSAPRASKSDSKVGTLSLRKGPKFNCSDLRRTALRMSTHASNLANQNTTRTPEGGPFHRLEVVCKAAGGAFCDVQKVGGERIVYQPGHPDADAKGYVKFPAIDAATETAGFNTAAAELKLFAAEGVCGAKVIEQDSTTVVKYHADFDVMMDTITFGDEQKVVRWARTTRDGRTQNMSFDDTGKSTRF